MNLNYWISGTLQLFTNINIDAFYEISRPLFDSLVDGGSVINDEGMLSATLFLETFDNNANGWADSGVGYTFGSDPGGSGQQRRLCKTQQTMVPQILN